MCMQELAAARNALQQARADVNELRTERNQVWPFACFERHASLMCQTEHSLPALVN